MSISELIFLTLAITPSIVALIAVPTSPSRRRLVVALSVGVPIAGPVLAVMAARVRGVGKLIEPGDLGDPRRDSGEAGQIRRMGELPPLIERLLSINSSDRQSALVTLAAQPDARAIQILRWAVEHGPPESVLDAALTLGELDLELEHSLKIAERAASERPTYDNLVDAGDLLAQAIHSGLADPVIVPNLAGRARTWYERAVPLATPEQRAELDERRARLELCAGRPAAAAELLEQLIWRERGRISVELAGLYERTRFAARRPVIAHEALSDAGNTGTTSLRALPARNARSPRRYDRSTGPQA
ncbi:MAG TPA: hypothetical protein VML75_21085 [Kofleriaceae bacterium]|nr:hypothetical protein [Kofleriaceae bacterium]